MGSPPFATPVFESVLASDHTVCALVTQPDRPRGRGRKVEASPLVERARVAGVEVVQPTTTKDPEFVERMKAHAPDVLLVASYGEILRADVLELAPHGALNVHASLLPRWRGASPIQRAIFAGDLQTGVSIQRMVLALDEGDVLLEERTPIGADETAGELLPRLAILGGEAAVQALDAIAEGSAQFTPQDPERVTYAKKLRKGDGAIDWTRPADELVRLVRAMNPWPLARTTLPDGRALAVWRARAEAGGDAEPGSLVPRGEEPVVACGSGVLRLLEVQPAGKNKMDGNAFLRGARLPEGTRLGQPEPEV
ncbi:MAG: methionyl-tRNA formyltransferase [bacterium]|nr:methionyl-tRNA formyltransferase [bacterium]